MSFGLTTASLSRCSTTRGDAELGGDGIVPLPFVGQLLERLELVGGMHGRAHFVLGQADLVGVLVTLDHAARDLRFVLVLLLRLGEMLECGEAPASGDDFKLSAVRCSHDEVGEQPSALMFVARPSMPSLVFVLRTFSGDGTSLLGGMVWNCMAEIFLPLCRAVPDGPCHRLFVLEAYHFAIRCQHKKSTQFAKARVLRDTRQLGFKPSGDCCGCQAIRRPPRRD